MKYNLYLDDYRNPIDSSYYRSEPDYAKLDWVVVRSYDEFIKKVEELGIPEVVSFDHDLADAHYKKQKFNYDDESQEKTGYHCAKWLIYYCIDNKKELPARILVHSMNPAGTQNIWSLFNSYWKSLSPS